MIKKVITTFSLIFFTLPLYALSTPEFTLDELIKNSDNVLIGYVERKEYGFEKNERGNKRKSFTKYNFQNSVVIKNGKAKNKNNVSIKVTGGIDIPSLNDDELSDELFSSDSIEGLEDAAAVEFADVKFSRIGGAPIFQSGVKYILFIDNGNKNDVPTLGGTSGIFKVDDAGSVYTYYDKPVIGIENGDLLFPNEVVDLTLIEQQILVYSEGGEDTITHYSDAPVVISNDVPMDETDFQKYIENTQK